MQVTTEGGVTEEQVLLAAAEAFSKPGSFVHDSYFGGEAYRPGSDVGVTCAIGGVEQAIWKATGEIVTHRRPLAYVDSLSEADEAAKDLDATHRVYARVMARLNIAAVRTVAGQEAEVFSVEEFTFLGDDDEKTRVALVRMFRKCAAEAARS